MGRGRAKAKQTKVARELKYGGPDTDLSRLQAELAGATPAPAAAVEPDDDEFDDDPYAKYLEDDEDDDDSTPRASAR